MGKWRQNKPDQTGRNQSKRWVRVYHDLMDTLAYRSLTPAARSLLFELVRRHNSKNNGELWLSVRDAAALMGVADLKAARAAFDELQNAGFIVMTSDAHFSVKAADTSRARCWRLTFEAVRSISKPATHDYRSFKPEGRAAIRAEAGEAAVKRWKGQIRENRMPVVETSTMRASFERRSELAVEENTTAKTELCGSAVHVDVWVSSTHTVTSREEGSRFTSWADHVNVARFRPPKSLHDAETICDNFAGTHSPRRPPTNYVRERGDA